MLTIWNAEISMLAVILATIANMIVGMLWYGPLFGEQWLQLVNKRKSDLVVKSSDYMWNMLAAFITAVVIALLTSYIQYASTGFADSAELLSGIWPKWAAALMAATLAWAGFTIPAGLNPVIWEGRSRQLTLFNMAHLLVSFIVTALIIALVS